MPGLDDRAGDSEAGTPAAGQHRMQSACPPQIAKQPINLWRERPGW
jgi:hypothetical protein